VEAVFSIDEFYVDNHCTTQLELETLDEDTNSNECIICVTPVGGRPIVNCMNCQNPTPDLKIPSIINVELNGSFGSIFPGYANPSAGSYGYVDPNPRGTSFEYTDLTIALPTPPTSVSLRNFTYNEAIRDGFDDGILNPRSSQSWNFSYGCKWGGCYADLTIGVREVGNYYVDYTPFDWTPVNQCDALRERVGAEIYETNSLLTDVSGRTPSGTNTLDYFFVSNSLNQDLMDFLALEPTPFGLRFNDFTSIFEHTGTAGYYWSELAALGTFYNFSNPQWFGDSSYSGSGSNKYYPTPGVLAGIVPPLNDPIWNTTESTIFPGYILYNGLHGYTWDAYVTGNGPNKYRVYLRLNAHHRGAAFQKTVTRAGYQPSSNFGYPQGSGTSAGWWFGDGTRNVSTTVQTACLNPSFTHDRIYPQGVYESFPNLGVSYDWLERVEIPFIALTARTSPPEHPWIEGGWASAGDYQDNMNPEIGVTFKTNLYNPGGPVSFNPAIVDFWNNWGLHVTCYLLF
jgi:hypothetical protein